VHDVLLRITAFVREHRGTFFSLVRGVASGDPAVRAVVDEAREANAEHLRVAWIELGEQDGPALRLALRSWVAFTEETLAALAAIDGTRPAEADEQVAAFLERTLDGVVSAARDAAF
jgi:hypothetical protein